MTVSTGANDKRSRAPVTRVGRINLPSRISVAYLRTMTCGAVYPPRKPLPKARKDGESQCPGECSTYRSPQCSQRVLRVPPMWHRPRRSSMRLRSKRRPQAMWRRCGVGDLVGALEPDSSAAPLSAARWLRPTTTVGLTTMAHPITRQAVMAPATIRRRLATELTALSATDPTIRLPERSSATMACVIPARDRGPIPEQSGAARGRPFLLFWRHMGYTAVHAGYQGYSSSVSRC